MIEQVPYNALDVKGRIKVELFEDDKKVNEVKSNNFISKGMKDYIFKLAMKSLFTQRRMKEGRKLYDEIQDMFQSICLTDASHPSDPENEWLMRGKLIGYGTSDASYSGADTLRGSYNIAESSTTKDSVKMVFDFPTHAANGTIKSVYFRNQTYPLPFYSKESLFNRVLRYNVAANVYKDKIYILGANITNPMSYTNKLMVYDKQFKLLQEYTLPYNFSDFEIKDDYLYFIKTHISESIYKSPIDNPMDISNIITTLPNGQYVRGIAFDESKNRFIVSSDNGTGRDPLDGIIEYDSNFNVLDSFTIPGIKGSNHGKLKYVDDSLLITTDGSIGSQILSDDYTVSTMRSVDFLCTIDNALLTYDGYITPKIEIASRCLLDTPITKSSNQHMKITYEFVLE